MTSPEDPTQPPLWQPQGDDKEDHTVTGVTSMSPRLREDVTDPFVRQPVDRVMRTGPGVPTPTGMSSITDPIEIAERAVARYRRRHRVRRTLTSLVTLALLATSGVVAYLRFHHSPLHVTGVSIPQPSNSGCTVDVTGRIDTNGSAGTVSYEWRFTPDKQAPVPLNQSVIKGQRSVYVTVAVQGAGTGTATQQVTLDVLGPDAKSASASVTATCP